MKALRAWPKGYDGRAVGACLAAIACAPLLLGALIWSLVGAVNDLESRLAEARRLAGSSDRRAVELAAAEALSKDARAVLIAAASEAEVQARFQSLLKTVAAEHGVEVDTLQPLKTERAGRLLKTTVKLDGSLPETGIGRFISALAVHKPMIVLESFELRPVPRRALASDSSLGRMAISFSFAAYAPPEAAGEGVAQP
jgi:hypothetical protein